MGQVVVSFLSWFVDNAVEEPLRKWMPESMLRPNDEQGATYDRTKVHLPILRPSHSV